MTLSSGGRLFIHLPVSDREDTLIAVFVLRPYQLEAVRAAAEACRRGVTRQLIVMATGLGKTVVIGGIAARARWGPGRRLFAIMHRDELIQQALEKLGRQNPSRTIDFEKAEHRSSEKADIVVASVQTVAREKRRLRFDPAQFSKVWIDEVHHAPAKSYVSLLEHFGLYGARAPDKLLLGTTATPERLDRLGYDRIFDDVVYRYGLREGIEDGWLADLACFRVATDVDLSGVRVRRGEFVESDLARAVDVRDRNRLCLKLYRERARDLSNLVFCVTKDHARHVASIFEEAGVRVGLVVEDTPADERRRAIEDFRAGALDVLVNVTILTEGVDLPEVGAIHLLRPTRSTSLLLQMIGRGTRKIAGKERCVIFDYADDFEGKDLASIGRVFNLPEKFDFVGGSVLGQVREIEEWEEELGELPLEDCPSLEALRAELERIDPLRLYAAVAKETAEFSDLKWHRRRKDHYAISWRSRTAAEMSGPPSPWLAEERRVVSQKKLWGRREILEIEVNQLGKWEVRLSRRRIDVLDSLGAAARRADRWVRLERPHVVHLLDRKAPWNRERSSPAQGNALVRRGYPRDVVSRLSKGEAAVLLQKPVPKFLTRQAGAKR